MKFDGLFSADEGKVLPSTPALPERPLTVTIEDGVAYFFDAEHGGLALVMTESAYEKFKQMGEAKK